MVKRTSPALLALTFLTTSILMSAAEQGEPVSVRARTELVQVPVVVQRSGKHVSGLKQSDFVLEQDGKQQPIALFEEMHPAPPRPIGGTEREFSNSGPNTTTPQAVTIIAIDTVNTPPMDQAYFRGKLLKFLSEAVDKGTSVGLVELNRGGIRVLHDFTTDPRVLIASIEKRRPTLPSTNSDRSQQVSDRANEAAQQLATASEEQLNRAQANFGVAAVFLENEDRMARFQDRTARLDTLASLQQLAQSLKGLPGRKSLLWVGSGFQFLGGVQQVSRITGTSPTATAHIGEALDQHAYTWKVLNEANVAVYPIDTRRTVNTAYEVIDPSRKYTPLDSEREAARQKDQETISTFEAIAAQTGGKPCIYRTDLDNCLREAADDTRDYYMLGFYVDKKSSAPGWHKIKVRLDQKASVRYRSGFVISKAELSAPSIEDIQLALNSPVAYTALPFYGRFEDFDRKAGKKTIHYQLIIPSDSLTIDQPSGRIDFDVVMLARAVGGKEVARAAQRIDRRLSPQNVTDIKSDGVHYNNRVELTPGEYGLWFVVRDNLSGRTGSALATISVP